MKRMQFTIRGIRPLIMSNPQTVCLSNKFAALSRSNSKLMKQFRKSGNEDKMAEIEKEQFRCDWEASAYWSEADNRFYVPDTLLLASIKAGATADRKGKDIDRFVIMSETHAFVEGVTQHRTLDTAFKDPEFWFAGPCRIPPKTGALVWKYRCVMPTGWKLTFTLEFDESQMSDKSVLQFVGTAGRISGIGGWRPKYGRFIVEESKVLDDEKEEAK